MGAREITQQLLGVNFGALFETVTPKMTFDFVLENLAVATKDMDMAGDPMDSAYYAGLADAYEIVARHMAPVINEPGLFGLLGKMVPALTPEQAFTAMLENANT